MPSRSLAVVLVLGLLPACRTHATPTADTDGTTPGTTTAEASASVASPRPVALRPRAPDATPPPRSRALPAAGAVVPIAAGGYHLGSTPGDPGRDPAVEADLVPVEVAAYDIDALPFPNDPGQAIQTGLSRDQAERACAAHGRRLCSEVEWERACRGRDEGIYPGGESWDPQCGHGDLGACASSWGTFAMGTRFAEWTTGDIDDRAIIRGAGRDAAAGLHRCAARRTAVPGAAGLEVAFRCCGGPAPRWVYPREVSRRPFRDEPMTAAQVSAIVAAVPELERLHLRDGLVLFSPPAIAEVLNHGNTTAEQHPEMTFTVAPVRWSPTFGEDLLVLVARSHAGSWIAALWTLPDGRYRHAASFLLRDDPVALTLAYSTSRREVAWASCWNCGGEYGAVAYTDDNRVAIVQH